MTRVGREVRVRRYPAGPVTIDRLRGGRGRGRRSRAGAGARPDYESEPTGAVPNLFLTVSKDLTLRGFRGSSHLDLWDEMQHQLTGWLRSGELVQRETVFAGLDAAPQALAAMIAGRTIGKTLVSIG